MYEDLISVLRECSKPGTRYGMAVIYMEKAADAIEELQGQIDGWIEQERKALLKSAPKWVSVTERLPKGEAERYLVAADFMAYGLRVSICYYADNLEEVDEYDFSGERHGGFYGYDSEYGHYEKNGVKYWMPLPEPPKEDKL